MIDLDSKFPPDGDRPEGVIFYQLHTLLVSPDGLRETMLVLARNLAMDSHFTTRVGLYLNGDGTYWVGFNHPIFAKALQAIVRKCYENDPERVEALLARGFRLAITARVIDKNVTEVRLRFSDKRPVGMKRLEPFLKPAEATRLYEAARKRDARLARAGKLLPEKSQAPRRGISGPFKAAGTELADGVRNIDPAVVKAQVIEGATNLGQRISQRRRFGLGRRRRLEQPGESE